STDDVEQLVIAGSAAGIAAVPVSGSIHVINNHTNAYIDSGAKVNTDQSHPAGSGQSVLVAAGSDYYHIGLAGAVGGAGVAAVGAGGGVGGVPPSTPARNNESAPAGAQQK